MDRSLYDTYVDILKTQLVPAMGCTEPIAVAYAAALAARALRKSDGGREFIRHVHISVSSNIIKNVKSVIVPNTDGLHGLEAAAAAGIVAGDPEKKLLVISQVTDPQKEQIRDFLHDADFVVEESDSGELFDILITLSSDSHTAQARIAGTHTNVVRIASGGTTEFEKTIAPEANVEHSQLEALQIDKIVEFAEAVAIEDVKETLDRQITCNMDIAREGLTHAYGARIGQVLLKARGDDPVTRAKAYAAAASDARMGGCEKPVVINSGSGNQGITTSIPVIIYAEHLGCDQEKLYRALVVSNLVTLHLKCGIGPLSAYCGAISAGCGAAAGVTYLYGGGFKEIAHTVVNALAINSGVICDGAKASCAAKIASAVEAGLLGMEMYRQGSQFHGGDGIVSKGVENTIRNVSQLASEGMRKTDTEIIKIMLAQT